MTSTPQSSPPSPQLQLELQCDPGVPVPAGLDFQAWGQRAFSLAGHAQPAERKSITLRLVDITEGEMLNQRFRGRPGPTNVLAFPAAMPPGLPRHVQQSLGDIVVCVPLVAREAQERGVGEQAHWAHLFVHGLLHLLGFDHEHDAEAAVMESKEAEVLLALGFSNPYAGECEPKT